MELDWSEHSPHIRTLYAPWQPGDGYEEQIITTEETRLRIRLPAPLRIFYQAWGKRKDLAHTNQALLGPAQLVRRPDALLFCAENQGTFFWAIEGKALKEADPSVVKADMLHNWQWSDILAPLIWEPSHAHVSGFLDSLTYQHAFWGGAMHGGSGLFQPQEFHHTWLEQHWHRMKVRPMAVGLADGYDVGLPEYIDIYTRDGQALNWFSSGCSIVARSAESLDEVGQVLQITWAHRW